MIRFYGQAPGSRANGGAFEGSALLVELADVPEHVLRSRVEFRNLLSEYPGRKRDGKGDLFPIKEARAAADREMERWREADMIVFAGREVARAFGLAAAAPWFEWEILGLEDGYVVEVAVFPHPSGASRFWNDAANRDAAAAFLRELIK